MASRKRKPDSPQVGFAFGGPCPSPSIEAETIAAFEFASQSTREPTPKAADLGSVPEPLTPSADASPKDRDTADHAFVATEGADIDLESFDDYDDTAMHDSVPRLRLVDPPREVSVIVEAKGESFEVCRLRDNGTTVASVMYTRQELLELVRRAQAALEV